MTNEFSYFLRQNQQTASGDVALISAAQAGDLESFNYLVLAYQSLVYNQAYRVLGERFAADDATQQAFISAFRKMSSFRGGSFRCWLLRIVTNVCYDEIRRRKRRPTCSLEFLNELGDEIKSSKWMVDPGELPEEKLVRTELARTIQDCLDKLPLKFRLIVILVDIQGMDYAETAEILDLPIGTVKSRLARGRARLSVDLRRFFSLQEGGAKM
jgi:RNA polymerase sigma factor (sigma-70 family)